VDVTVSRALAPFVAVINHLMRRVDYLALYEAEVISQNADLSLELKIVDPVVQKRVGPASKIPIRHGLPGYSVKVKKGARVLMGWADGNARKPYASLWESGVVEDVFLTSTGGIELNAARVKLTAAGAQPVARQGDLVTIETLPPPIGHPFVLIFADAGVIVPGKPYQVILATAPGLPLVGQISTGNPALEG
jgi:hypothetical protein